MNYWTQLSADFASQRNYLDELYRVYPLVPALRRQLNQNSWNRIEEAYNNRDNLTLIKQLLQLELFPIKDSYVAYLRKDPSSIERNPNTINRLAGNLYQLGLDTIYDKCTEPKETNRQMGPMFKRWLNQGAIGCPVFDNVHDFLATTDNAILNVSDTEMKNFANTYLGYTRRKGLDFIARFNNKYVIAEAKFLTAYGGHQDRQFEDATSLLDSQLQENRLGVEVYKIAILDGVLYIHTRNSMYNYLVNNPDKIVLSSLVLREFLYSL